MKLPPEQVPPTEGAHPSPYADASTRHSPSSEPSMPLASRRQFLRMIAMAGGGAVLAACGGSNPAAPAGGAATSAPDAAAAPTATTAAAATTAPAVTSAPAVAAGTVTLTIMSQSNELSDDEIKAFMDANPGIKVERIERDDTRFKAMLAAGTPPDLFRVFEHQIAYFAARDLVLDLTPYFESSSVLKRDDLAPPADFYVVNGKIYGMPKDWSPDSTLYASTAAFKDAGIEVPTTDKPITYAELGDLARKLTKREGNSVVRTGYAYEQPWLPRQVQCLLLETDEKLYSDDMTRIVLRENSNAVAMLRWFHDLAKEQATYSPIHPPKAWIGQDFVDGAVGLIQYGYWFSGMISTTPDAMVGAEGTTFLPAPTWSGKKVVNPTVIGVGFAIAKGTKNPDAAWKFFEFYNAGQPAITRAKSGWGVPGLKSLYPMMPKESPFQQQVHQVLEREFNNANYTFQVNPYYDDAAFAASWSKNLEQALKGDITFDQLVENVENDVNQGIADGKAEVG